jgi:hypothetical protein
MSQNSQYLNSQLSHLSLLPLPASDAHSFVICLAKLLLNRSCFPQSSHRRRHRIQPARQDSLEWVKYRDGKLSVFRLRRRAWLLSWSLLVNSFLRNVVVANGILSGRNIGLAASPDWKCAAIESSSYGSCYDFDKPFAASIPFGHP